MPRADLMPACHRRHDRARPQTIPRRSAPCPSYSTVAGDQRHCESRRALEARKRQLYGRPYMRTDAINRFASSELCRSLQDGGKTPLTVGLMPSRLYAVPGRRCAGAWPRGLQGRLAAPDCGYYQWRNPNWLELRQPTAKMAHLMLLRGSVQSSLVSKHLTASGRTAEDFAEIEKRQH